MTIVNVLGIPYRIIRGLPDEYPALMTIDGYTDTSVKTIVVTKAEHDDPESKKDLNYYYRAVIRHEIIHAFLFESGLNVNSNGCESWATNEEMVDWMAIQFPKMCKAFEEAECMEVE